MTLARYVYQLNFSRRRVAEMPPPIQTPEAAYAFVRTLFEDAESERLFVVLLDRRHHPIGVSLVYQGTVTGMSVRVGELFRDAVRLNACAVLVCHNHPSGDATPSAEDVRTTRDAIAAGRLLGIDLIDHLVIGADNFVSIASLGGYIGRDPPPSRLS